MAKIHLLALLVPLLIYILENSSTPTPQPLSTQTEGAHLCQTYCSSIQPANCYNKENCNQTERCRMLELFDICKQFCLNRIEQMSQDKNDSIDPEQVCFQNRRLVNSYKSPSFSLSSLKVDDSLLQFILIMKK